MAPTRGFQEVLNGNANGAGIVLPESETTNYVIDQIAKNGLLQQRQAAANKVAAAQINKDFATNKIKLNPAIQYRTEVNGLAQKWYDKGVQYRRQNFDPFNPDYNKPDQVSASQQYLAEKKHIEDLSDLAKEVDTHYNENKKASQEGKLAGFEEYQDKIKNTTLHDLYNNGGVNALPQLYKPFDTHTLDQQITLKPQTRQVSEQVPGAPAGVVETKTEHYVDLPQAARTAETAMLNQPGVTQYLQKKGVNNVKGLYTLGGHNMQFDPKNPEDFGHIDEPGIYHQMTVDYLTKPDLIKQLPDEVKRNIINSKNAVKLFNGGRMDMSKVGDAMMNSKPYNAADDPAFKTFIDGKFDQQIKQERGYQSEIADAIHRKLPSLDLGSTSKLDATMANLRFRQATNNQGRERLNIAKQNAAITAARWQEHLANNSTRKQWIDDIQNSHPDAIASLQSAVKEVNGTVKAVKGGVEVRIPETVPNFVIDPKTNKPTTVINPVQPKKQVDHIYKIDKYSGRPGRIQIEQVLNKLPTFGKEKGLKTEPYTPDYNNLGDNTSADDL